MATKRLLMRKLREILRLKYETRLPHRAIAQACGVGAGTVSVYLARARAAGLSWPLERAAVPQQVIANVRDLILTTKHHSTPATPDQALLIDIDLSILGAAPDRFDEYERQIRHEYSWVTEDAYRDARVRVLREFQDRHLLYTTEHFRKTLEVRARENLARSLRSLGA